jgi:phosphoribosylformylglycinamidine (FGAM) synthase-like enzyme
LSKKAQTNLIFYQVTEFDSVISKAETHNFPTTVEFKRAATVQVEKFVNV